MKPKTIGILGGAGPLAGALLLERIFSFASSIYGCYRDADFPKVILLSFPFSEMLTDQMDEKQVRHELNECLTQLRKNGAEILAIACNTLHAFLQNDHPDLVHLPQTLAAVITTKTPLVFCTSTSAKFGLHKQFFSCIYPDCETQREVDLLIDRILQGIEQEITKKELERLLEEQPEQTIILGCTELSLLNKQLIIRDKTIMDPIDVVAKKVLERSFKEVNNGIKYSANCA